MSHSSSQTHSGPLVHEGPPSQSEGLQLSHRYQAWEEWKHCGNADLLYQPSFMLNEKYLIENWWSLENIGITDTLIPDDEKASEIIEETIKRYQSSDKELDGRYEVEWPLKDDPMKIPSNYIPALSQLKSVLKRLKVSSKGDTNLFNSYDDIFKLQEEKGIIERVSPQKPGPWAPVHPIRGRPLIIWGWAW